MAPTSRSMAHLTAARLIAWAALFGLWTLATWWLEGRIQTLLRPDAVLDRVSYVVGANLIVGLGGAALLARSGAEPAAPPSPARVAASVAAAAALGCALLLVAGAPGGAWVAINGYAQVLTVSVAEVAVCWWALQAALDVGRRLSIALTVAVGAVAFGLYHFAHSPPFDTWPMVAGLTGMGVVTGAWLVASRDVYGTVVFHNFAGTLGVTQALEASDRLATYERPMVPTLLMGALAFATLIVVERLAARRATASPAPREA